MVHSLAMCRCRKREKCWTKELQRQEMCGVWICPPKQTFYQPTKCLPLELCLFVNKKKHSLVHNSHVYFISFHIVPSLSKVHWESIQVNVDEKWDCIESSWILRALWFRITAFRRTNGPKSDHASQTINRMGSTGQLYSFKNLIQQSFKVQH